MKWMNCAAWAAMSFTSLSLSAQVEIDQAIELTGAEGNRRISNLELPVADEDAANKAYVDNAVSASGSGGGLPTMLSGESSTAMHLGDAIRYCRDLVEDGHSDWRLPNYAELIAAASTDDTVTNDTSANNIHIGANDVGSISLGTNTGATNYYRLGIRLSDGNRTIDFLNANPSYHVRCVR